MKENVATVQNQGDQLQGRSPSAQRLLELAAQAQELVGRISNESEAYRKAGRLVRLSQFSIYDLTKEELLFLIEAHSHADGQSSGPLPSSIVPLHLAIELVSSHILTELWNEWQPNPNSDSWKAAEEHYPEVASAWREKVYGLLKKCGQDAVLSLTPKKYADYLISAGASEQEADYLTEWLSEAFWRVPGLLK